MCVREFVSISCVSSSLSKCQSKLLLFPDHAVGDGPTSSPWQPSVLAQRKSRGQRRKELLSLWNPTTFLVPLVLVYCSPGLNHVAELPGLTVTGDEGERGTVERDFIKKKISKNVIRWQKCWQRVNGTLYCWCVRRWILIIYDTHPFLIWRNSSCQRRFSLVVQKTSLEVASRLLDFPEYFLDSELLYLLSIYSSRRLPDTFLLR